MPGGMYVQPKKNPECAKACTRKGNDLWLAAVEAAREYAHSLAERSRPITLWDVLHFTRIMYGHSKRMSRTNVIIVRFSR